MNDNKMVWVQFRQLTSWGAFTPWMDLGTLMTPKSAETWIAASPDMRRIKPGSSPVVETHTEWTLVIDGDPRMDGTHERREVGRFRTLAEARRGYQTITVTMRLPSDEVRIEKREVGPWEVVQPWEITNDILATESRDRDE